MCHEAEWSPDMETSCHITMPWTNCHEYLQQMTKIIIEVIRLITLHKYNSWDHEIKCRIEAKFDTIPFYPLEQPPLFPKPGKSTVCKKIFRLHWELHTQSKKFFPNPRRTGKKSLTGFKKIFWVNTQIFINFLKINLLFQKKFIPRNM